MRLQIRHINTQDSTPQFVVVRVRDGKQTNPVSITPPWEIMVGTQTLQQELQWYLEKFLKLPIDTSRKRAEAVQTTLSQWGRDCFDALFVIGQAQGWYRDASQKDLSNLRLEIVSNDASVLSWPWEALESTQDGRLALQCHIERRLDNVGDVNPLMHSADDELRILYIIARSKGDVLSFQTQARHLISFAAEGGWPIRIDVLRPPTFKRLEEILEDKPYHIVHFDGHGSFDNASGGALVFEKDDAQHSADLVSADKMWGLLRKRSIPVMVLDACKSAAHVKDGNNPFASVAVNLLKSGIHSVVANSYNIYDSSAKIFVPAFYQRLVKSGSVAQAVQAGRREMFSKNERDTSYGKVALHDWIVPVLYQHEDDFLPQLKPGSIPESKLPAEAQMLGDYGFVGRDRAIQQLERAIRRKPAGILIHGMAGEGKTTLAKGFLQWLESTSGLGAGAFWFNFEDIHSAEYVINTLAGSFFGSDALAASTEQKLAAVTKALRENPFFIVWDNFESVCGIPGTEVSAKISDEDDRKQLKQLLHDLKGGKTKILITSRSKENWLPLPDCYRLPLGGLQGEELWQYCNAVLSDLDLTLDQRDEIYHEILEMLGGNPLAVRAILLRLNDEPAPRLLAQLKEGFRDTGDDTGRIQAALGVFERGLDSAFAPVLRLLGLHEHYADADYIGVMLKVTDEDAPVGQCFAALESVGLCRSIGNNIYRLHPALRACLDRAHPAHDGAQRAFVDVMGSLAYVYGRKQLHEQRDVFVLFSANFHRALRLAKELDMREDVLVLTQALAAYAQNTRNFSEATIMYTQLFDVAKKYEIPDCESVAYHQLGIIAQERRDFAAADDWYKKSLDIELKQGNEHGVAFTYGQLGMIAQERGDLSAAEDRCTQAKDIFLRHGDEHNAAIAYHQLGGIAEERRDFAAAEGWYMKSLDIKLKKGNERGVALTYGQLGIIAQERGDLSAAEDRYTQAKGIFLRHGDEHGVAIIFHSLGMLAQERADFAAAEDCYEKAMNINLKYGDEHGAAITYHQLGMLAQERGDFAAAEGLYKKALEIFERCQGDPSITRKNLDNLHSMSSGGAT